MTELSIETLDGSTFEVTVHGRSPTTHRVKVDPDYLTHLTSGTISADSLVRMSFEFLLEREPNTSILSRFDLPVIGRYFPEYESWIRARLP
jgi:hypothetical protein